MVPMVYSVPKGCFNVCGLNCAREHAEWSMLMDDGGHVDVYGPCALTRNHV